MKKVIAAIDDLFFMAKVKDAAVAAGMGIEFARSKDDALARSTSKGTLVVVDLNADKFSPIDLVIGLKAKGTPVLAFLSHVNVELRAKAQEAGADQVVARSALAQNIQVMFREFAAASPRDQI